MDLALYLRVVWRFRYLVAAGAVVAAVVAFFSIAHVKSEGGSPSVAYRASSLWESQSELLVTQRGFPWGRSTFSEEDREEYGDPGRFTGLAMLYAELATSDVVRDLIGPAAENGEIRVKPQVAADNMSVLPLLTVKGTASTPDAAEELTLSATKAFGAYLAGQQEAAGIRPAERVEISVISQPSTAVVVEEPKLVRPIFLFALIFIATIGLAFVLENLRPRQRPALAVAPLLHSDRERLPRTQSSR